MVTSAAETVGAATPAGTRVATWAGTPVAASMAVGFDGGGFDFGGF